MNQAKLEHHKTSYLSLLGAGILIVFASLSLMGQAQAAMPQAAAGKSSSCALSSYGTVWCWGDNSSGQLGYEGSGLIPHQVTGLTDVIRVAAGQDFNCALQRNQTVWCWGDNQYGSLGNGKNLDSMIPVQVSGLDNIAQLSTSGSGGTVCALDSSGLAWCWGDNQYGQLGDNSTTNHSVPVQVALTGISKIAAGGYSTCALLESGQVKCWGKGWYGELGNGFTNDSNTPVAVTGISTAVDLDLGLGHACAVLDDGSVKCWGRNLVGQLGDGSTDDHSVAVAVTGISAASNIALGAWHSCVLLNDGSAQCWGLNSANPGLGAVLAFSQLGDGSNSDSSIPVPVDGLSGATSLSSGDQSTCAITNEHIKCWGDNTLGQVGVGYVSLSGSDSSSPSSVSSFPMAVQDVAAPDAPVWTQPDPTSETSVVLNYQTSEAGGTTECRINESEWAACTSFDGTAGSLALADLQEGTYVVEARQTDISGNVSEIATVNLVIDQTAPMLATITPVDDPSGWSQQTLSFTLSETGGVTQCRLDDGEWADCTAIDDTSGTFDTGEIGDGLHTFHVRQTDAAGNIGSESSFSWTIDTASPDIPTIAQLDDPLSDSAPSISFILSETGGTVECNLDNGEWTDCALVDGLNGAYQTTDLAEGEHTLQVRQTDAAGNTGDPDSMTWVTDTQAPDTPEIAQPETPTQDVAPTISFTLGENNGTVECKLNEGDWTACSSIDDTSGTYESADLADGTYTLHIRHTDAADNTSTVAETTWVVDTQAPKAPEAIKFTTPTSNTSPNISFKLGETGGTIECKLDDGEWGECESQDGAIGTYQTAGLVDGSHTINMRQTDQVGNASKAGTFTWVVDTAAPLAPTITPISTPNHHTNMILSATLIESSGSSECQLDDGGWTACTTRSGDVITFVVHNLTQGQHNFQVRQTDTAGNVGEPDSVQWTIDTQAPDAPQVTPLANPNNDANPVLNFQLGELDGTVQCKFDNKPWADCTSIDGLEGTYDPDTLSDGPHALKVRQTDAAGNLSAAGGFAWTVDTIAPRTPVITAIATPNKNSTQAIHFVLSQTTGTTECKLDDGEWSNCTLVVGKSGNYNTGELSDGSHSVQVRQTDLADNASSPGIISWMIDTQAPLVPVLTQSPASKTYINSAVFTWTSETGSISWCSLDNKAWATCVSSKTLTKLAAGNHIFIVKLIDAAGNASTAVTTNWNYSEPPVPAVQDFDLTPESAALAVTTQTSSRGKTIYTTARSLVYSLTFDRAVTGLGVADFTMKGTSGKWSVQSVTGSGEGPYLITASNTTGGEGNLDITLSAKTVASVSAGTLGPAVLKTSGSLVVLDHTAPVAPRLSGLPSSRTAAQSLTISIAGESAASFLCSIDAGSWQACTSPWTISNLDEGVHTASVKQTDLAGNTSTAGVGSWTVHISPPAAPSITAKPLDNTDKAGSVWFSGESKATFVCRIDAGAWQTCVAPFIGSNLVAGQHSVQIKQTDELGKTSEPVETSWTTSTPMVAETAKTRMVRTGNKLTCSLVAPAPGGSSLDWQWFSDGALVGSGGAFIVPDSAWGKDMVCVAAVKTGSTTRGYQSDAWNEALPKPAFTTRAALNRAKRAAQVYVTGYSYGPINSTIYQWNINGVAVSGATRSTYNWSSSDTGKIISCTITLTNSSGSTSFVSSFKA